MSLVSAEITSECFGDVEGINSFICVYSGTTSNGDSYLNVVQCTKDKEWECHSLRKANMIPAGLKADIDASVKEEVRSNTYDTKNLGDLKNDNLQTQERKAGKDQMEFGFPNKTLLAP